MQTGLTQKLSAGSWIQHDLQEYLLIANPDVEVYNKVTNEQQVFSREFGEQIAVRTKPQITIANFLAKEVMEETIIRYMHRICRRQQRFEVALNNYSGFPPHTIYLRVQNQEPFKQLTCKLKAVSNYINSCDCPEATFRANPHVIIARKLPEQIYFKALSWYAQKTFHETFMVNELLLLRRSNPFENTKTINVFQLQPVSNNLFN